MFISVFELFKIGIGPSSSHTVGPMKAALHFIADLKKTTSLDSIAKIDVHLYGSLALTGKGHGTDLALMLGLTGKTPESILTSEIKAIPDSILKSGFLDLNSERKIKFIPSENILFKRSESLPHHPNGMTFIAYHVDDSTNPILNKNFYSVGGGFIIDDEQISKGVFTSQRNNHPFPFSKGDDLLEIGKKHSLKIHQIIFQNEKTYLSEEQIHNQLQDIWNVMQKCVLNGYTHEGHLPGGLKVKRRAPSLYKELSTRPELALKDPLSILDWVNLYALSVNEENASFGQVVTAPTNGAAGIIPAVLHYYHHFIPHSNEDGIFRFLLTAAGIGMLYKLNASISGAEVGCQGEVGVASSMAAAALVEVLGGTNEQIENAAEIAMEHHLGMTCDPVGGLVQIPCIERNAMGAIKAINAARIALRGNGEHFISLDKVIETMRQTGLDMSSKYKETSRGGLAVNIPEC